MAEITASLVKQLRDDTGAGMMDCKKALTESDGDIESAKDWLRTKGLAAAAKKAGRVAAEGLVGVATRDGKGVVVELNAETDFVSRNEDFQAFLRSLLDVALDTDGDLATLNAAAMPGGGTVEEAVTNLIATIGENISLRRVASLSAADGTVASYIHSAVADGMGRIGVLVALESGGDKGALDALGRQLAMHVAAASPQWLETGDVDTAALDRERTILAEQASDSGKPPEIIEKMVEGRLRKFYEETVLLEQVYVIDGESKVRKAVEAAAKDLGGSLKVTGFARFALGEGVEREEEDFAAEVAKTLGQDSN